MNKLEVCREKIDSIDTKIIELYEQRMEVVKDVIKYKIENNIAVLDASRESLMLEKNLAKINNNDLKRYYEDVLKGYLSASKKLQEDILKANN